MKNIEIGSTKHLILQIVITIIVGLILFPLGDYLYYTFITNTEFVYTVNDYIIEPIVFGLVCGTVIWLVNRKKVNKKNK